MPDRFEAKWADAAGRHRRTRFFALELADAVAIVEDLAEISAASWVELRQNGSVVTVSSPAFGRPAGTQAYAKEVAVIEVRGANTKARHSLRLPAVLPAYVDSFTKRTKVNPFRDIGKMCSSEGEPTGKFVQATYKYHTKDTKEW